MESQAYAERDKQEKQCLNNVHVFLCGRGLQAIQLGV